MSLYNYLLIVGALPGNARTSLGGATILMQNFINYLDSGSLPYTFVQTNRFRRADGTSKRFINVIFFLIDFFLKLPFHKVIMFNFSNNATTKMFPILSKISKVLGKKVVLRKFAGSLETYLPEISEKKRKNLISALRQVDLVFLETKSGINHLHRIVPEIKQKIMWFPNIREKSYYQKEVSDFNRQIVFLGHIRDSKGVGDLINIANLLPEDYYVNIYGHISEEKYRNFNWASTRVNYHGEISSKDVPKILSESMLLILPSYSEGYPGVIIEAFSARIPVIASNVGGIPEIVEDGVNGLLCSPGDIGGFRDAIIAITEQNYSDYCNNALKSFNENFDAKKVNDRIYDKLMNL